MIVGCYSIELYCDNPQCIHLRDHTFPRQYTGRIESECFTKARKDGWRIYTDVSKALCPACVKEKVYWSRWDITERTVE